MSLITSRFVNPVQIIPAVYRGGVAFYRFAPHGTWKIGGAPALAALTKKLVGNDADLTRAALREETFGRPFDPKAAYALPTLSLTMPSPSTGEPTAYAVTTFVERLARGDDRRLGGEWLTRREALAVKELSPTARAALTAPMGYAAGDIRDRATFDAAFAAAAPGIRHFLSRRVRDGHRLDDMMQDVYLAAAARLDFLDPALPVGPWLYTIASNLTRAVYLDVSRSRCGSAETDRPGREADPSADAIARETAGEAHRALDEYFAKHPRHEAIWRMRFDDGMTNQEIAARLGMTPVSVGLCIHRVRKFVHGRLGRGE